MRQVPQPRSGPPRGFKERAAGHRELMAAGAQSTEGSRRAAQGKTTNQRAGLLPILKGEGERKWVESLSP